MDQLNWIVIGVGGVVAVVVVAALIYNVLKKIKEKTGVSVWDITLYILVVSYVLGFLFTLISAIFDSNDDSENDNKTQSSDSAAQVFL